MEETGWLSEMYYISMLHLILNKITQIPFQLMVYYEHMSASYYYLISVYLIGLDPHIMAWVWVIYAAAEFFMKVNESLMAPLHFVREVHQGWPMSQP